ncbi:MAG: T9SS type A sorting domain-containing protein, partial [Muribaculaceae bacterium]|nr:T9SS type A sorting domain-containing protein [Muribaculaceae bacterium]
GLKYIYTNYLGVESAVAPDELKPIIRHLSDEQLEIVLNADVVDGEVMMCDMSGNIVATKSFSGNIVELEHRGTAGVYILSIKTEKGNSVNRILVK